MQSPPPTRIHRPSTSSMTPPPHPQPPPLLLLACACAHELEEGGWEGTLQTREDIWREIRDVRQKCVRSFGQRDATARELARTRLLSLDRSALVVCATVARARLLSLDISAFTVYAAEAELQKMEECAHSFRR